MYSILYKINEQIHYNIKKIATKRKNPENRIKKINKGLKKKNKFRTGKGNRGFSTKKK